MRRTVLVLALLGLVACSPKGSETPAPGAKFSTDLPMTEFMGHVVDPAAFMYWKGAGYEMTEAGEKDLSPTTDEGWDVLVSGASILMEAGNMMQLPGRTRAPEADWNRYAQQLTAQAKVARDAAERHDKQAVFDEGGRLYEVCVACHQQFIIQPQEQAGATPKGKLPEAK